MDDVVALYENPIELLRTRVIDGGVSATPLCLAVIGWLCDFPTTEPRLVAVQRTTDGHLFGQLSDDSGANEFLGDEEAFLSQIQVICETLAFSDAQTKQVLRETRRKLG